MHSARIIERSVSVLKPYANNARVHSKKQIRQIADSIKRFGFTNPVLVSDNDEIIAGHGRVEAARLLGLATVPTIALSHLSAAERRAYILADNKLALNAGWDNEILSIEFQGLIDLDFDLSVTGFSVAEVDFILDHATEGNPAAHDEPEDVVPPVAEVAVSRQGDLWHLGRHRLICGDARDPDVFAQLLGVEQADMVFTDPPYNVPIDRNVSGRGRFEHREFSMAAGEMSKAEFAAFLTETLSGTALAMRDGAIAFVCMDWRHMGEILSAGGAAFTELKNLVVWNKTNAGMGSFYRSKHELIFVFKEGTAPHINNFGLGGEGRPRNNVWDYAGTSSFGDEREHDLELHPTTKPVALVADAIRDCSKRGQIVLDAFGGSGTTLIACEKTGRAGRLIEYDPRYCDTIIRRWQLLTGKQASLDMSHDSFEAIAEARAAHSMGDE